MVTYIGRARPATVILSLNKNKTEFPIYNEELCIDIRFRYYLLHQSILGSLAIDAAISSSEGM